MIKAKLELKGTGANMVRVVCYLEKEKDKSDKRYFVRTPVLGKSIDETYDLEIPTYWIYGRIFLVLRSKMFIFTSTKTEIPLRLSQYTPGERNDISTASFNGNIFLTVEEEVFNFPKELPSGNNIRSAFFQVPLRNRPKKCFQFASLFAAYKSDASNDPKNLRVKTGLGTSFLEPVDGLDVNLINHPRTTILEKMKKIPNDLFLIIVPGFFTNESFDFDIHYCVESPQFGDDDFVRPHIAEKAVEHFSFDSDEDGFAAVTANRCIFCCDDYKVVEIEPQIIYSPNMKYYSQNYEYSRQIAENLFKSFSSL